MIWLKILIGVVVWILVIILIIRQISHIHVIHLKSIGKLDFIEWYQENKKRLAWDSKKQSYFLRPKAKNQ